MGRLDRLAPRGFAAGDGRVGEEFSELSRFLRRTGIHFA
jgi:hypothetical protein